MNDISAAIGLANMSLVDETLALHQQNADYYGTALRDVPGIGLLQEDADRDSAYWLFTIRAERRDDLKRKLEERGIMSGMVHRRNDQYSCTREFVAGELPGTDILDREMLCIPVGWWVVPEDRERIADTIKEGW